MLSHRIEPKHHTQSIASLTAAGPIAGTSGARRKVLRFMEPGLRDSWPGTSSWSYWEVPWALREPPEKRYTQEKENRCTNLEITVLWKSLRLIQLLNFAISIFLAQGNFQSPEGMSKCSFAYWFPVGPHSMFSRLPVQFFFNPSFNFCFPGLSRNYYFLQALHQPAPWVLP